MTNGSESSRKQIHFWLSERAFQKWDEFAHTHGYSLSEFIKNTVNSVVFPLSNNRESLDTELAQLKEIRAAMEKDLQDLLKQRETLYSQHQQRMPKLEYRVLDYLEKVGSANEYLIAQDLQAQASEVYHVCAYLVSQKKIHQDEKGNWMV